MNKVTKIEFEYHSDALAINFEYADGETGRIYHNQEDEPDKFLRAVRRLVHAIDPTIKVTITEVC